MISLQDLYSKFLQHPVVCTDTRTISDGCIFFALKGGNFNGNRFAKDALEKGAAYAVVDEKEYFLDSRTLLVHDVLTSLQDLAKHHRHQLKTTVIALTGSNGKTTTKELMHKVLSAKYETLATIGNLNNHIGVPLTLLRLTEKHTHAIIEMGANHTGEIEMLCSIAEPNFGLITNIGKAHLEGFGGETGVAKGKSELYFYLYKHNGTAFVNREEMKTVQYSKHNKCIYFSSFKGDEQVAEPITLSPNIEFILEGKSYSSVLSGDYNFRNILSAIAVGKYFKVDAGKIGQAITSYIPQNMRHQWVEWDSNKVLLDAYNANPDSMRAALDNFNSLNEQNKIVVLGDMFELGKESKAEHQNIIDILKGYDFDQALVCGEYFSTSDISNKIIPFKTFEELKAYFSGQNYSGKTILIKGSRGMKMERLIDNG